LGENAARLYHIDIGEQNKQFGLPVSENAEPAGTTAPVA